MGGTFPRIAPRRAVTAFVRSFRRERGGDDSNRFRISDIFVCLVASLYIFVCWRTVARARFANEITVGNDGN